MPSSAYTKISHSKELECGNSYLDVLIDKGLTGMQTTKHGKSAYSGLHTYWTSLIPHHQKRNFVCGLLNKAYKFASTCTAIHSEFLKIKSMLIKSGYPKVYLYRCIMKYLNKKHEVPVHCFTKNYSMTENINIHIPGLGEISYGVPCIAQTGRNSVTRINEQSQSTLRSM